MKLPKIPHSSNSGDMGPDEKFEDAEIRL